MEVRIKICGITTLEDALAAVQYGTNALGFILVKKSPRYVSPEKVRAIVSSLPPFIQTVGVFVNESPQEVRHLIEYCGLDLVQFHGEESPDYCKAFSTRAIKALRVKDASAIEEIDSYRDCVRGILLDSWSSKAHGGTGKRFDWDLARQALDNKAGLPVILAGGLDVSSVQDAILKVRPFGVDVSSGVEVSPGKKDKKLVKDFIKRVKEAAQRVTARG